MFSFQTCWRVEHQCCCTDAWQSEILFVNKNDFCIDFVFVFCNKLYNAEYGFGGFRFQMLQAYKTTGLNSTLVYLRYDGLKYVLRILILFLLKEDRNMLFFKRYRI